MIMHGMFVTDVTDGWQSCDCIKRRAGCPVYWRKSKAPAAVYVWMSSIGCRGAAQL